MADGKQTDPCTHAKLLIEQGDPAGAAMFLENQPDRNACCDRLLGLAYFLNEQYDRAHEVLEDAARRWGETLDDRALSKLSAANARAGLPDRGAVDQEFNRDDVLAPPPVRKADLPSSPASSPDSLRRKLERSVGVGLGALADVAWRGMGLIVTLWHENRRGIWTTWDEETRLVGLAILASMREQLELRNLKNPYPSGSLTAFQSRGLVRPRATDAYRTSDGSWNDPNNPREGSANVRFPRNVDTMHSRPESESRLREPNPAVISQELLARGAGDMQEVEFLNLLAAAWIQFMVHDWVSHRTYPPNVAERAHTIEVPVPPGHIAETYYQRHLRVGRTMSDPTRMVADEDSPATTLNEVTSWWDASQLYGSDAQTTNRLRSRCDGKLRLDGGWLPLDEHGAELAGYTRNWWLGLSMLTTLFVKEHNAICDELRACNPTWDDDRLFHTARLVNAAVLAKLHTVEWTPAILPNPTLTMALETNWYGLFERTLFRKHRKTLRRIKIRNAVLGGLVGNQTAKHGVPYGLTEEFVEVYRMHELLPDHIRLHRFDSQVVASKEVQLPETRGNAAPEIMREYGLASLLYSFGIQSPGAIVLHNYPNSMRQLAVTGAPLVDVAATDIIRARERGVPRYNEFRRQLGLRPIEKFEDLTADPRDVALLKHIYGDVESIDMHVGTRAEQRRPKGFGFGETLFEIFIINASRRLEADHFFTKGYTVENYTKAGLEWVERATFKSVLLRHHPELATTGLANVENAFEPWDTGIALDPKRHPLRSINRSSWLQRIDDGLVSLTQSAVMGTRDALTTLRERVEEIKAKRKTNSAEPAFGLTQRVKWQFRRGVWDAWLLVKFVGNTLDDIPVPPDQIAPIDYVPLHEIAPSIPIETITVADHVPEDEFHRFKNRVYRTQVWMADVFGPQQPGVPEVGSDSDENLRHALGSVKRLFVREPKRAEPLRGAIADLGELALAGPYWGYLVGTGEPNTWQWDLQHLGQFEHHPGLRKLGVLVRFEADQSGRKLVPTRIDCELGCITRADESWPLAVRLALCAITTEVSLLRHFNAIHLAFGAKFAQATRNQLPTLHPLLRLVWPHIHDTQYSNSLVTLGQMLPAGDFPAIFSFTHKGMCELFEYSYQRLHLESFDPERDAAARGELFSGLDTRGLDQMRETFDVLLTHVTRYVNTYYDSDEALARDGAVRDWVEEMRSQMPNGIPLSIGPVSRGELSRLIAVLLNVVITEHMLRDASPWDYILWTDRAPIRVYQDDSREPIDVYQRLVNANMVFQLKRTLVTKDFSYLAIDPRGAQLFRDFRKSLLALQARYDSAPRQTWRLNPDTFNANINF